MRIADSTLDRIMAEACHKVAALCPLKPRHIAHIFQQFESIGDLRERYVFLKLYFNDESESLGIWQERPPQNLVGDQWARGPVAVPVAYTSPRLQARPGDLRMEYCSMLPPQFSILDQVMNIFTEARAERGDHRLLINHHADQVENTKRQLRLAQERLNQLQAAA